MSAQLSDPPKWRSPLPKLICAFLRQMNKSQSLWEILTLELKDQIHHTPKYLKDPFMTSRSSSAQKHDRRRSPSFSPDARRRDRALDRESRTEHSRDRHTTSERHRSSTSRTARRRSRSRSRGPLAQHTQVTLPEGKVARSYAEDDRSRGSHKSSSRSSRPVSPDPKLARRRSRSRERSKSKGKDLDREDRRRTRRRSAHSSSEDHSSEDSDRSRNSKHRKEKKKSKDKKRKKEKKKRRHRDSSVSSRGSSDEDVRRSAITGKKLKLKVHKTVDDKVRERNRTQLLQHLNQMYD